MPKDAAGAQIYQGSQVIFRQADGKMLVGQVVQINESRVIPGNHTDPRVPPQGNLVIVVPIIVPFIADTRVNVPNVYVTMGQPEVGKAAFSTEGPEEN